MTRKLSARGASDVLIHEGKKNRWYLDPVGIPTIGAGFTWRSDSFKTWWKKNKPGQKFAKGASMTDAEINDALRFLVDNEYGASVNKFLGRKKVPQHVFDGMVSVVFNLGARSLKWNWAKAIKAGDYGKAAEHLRTTGVTAKGKRLRGLVIRRGHEADMISKGKYRSPEVGVDLAKPGSDKTVVTSVKPKETKRNPASNLLPLFRPKQADVVTRAVWDKFKHLVPSDRHGDKVKVLFVRGYYQDSMGKKGVNDRAIYDDAAFVISPDGIQPFNANSDPSRFRRRIANLKAPQAVRYIPGKHGLSRPDGGYPAFRQNSNVTVIRDNVGPDTDSPKKRFWINLHRGGVNGTSSLGCLTIPRHQWDEFRDLISGLLHTYGQGTFYVVLVEYDGDNPPVDVTALTRTPADTKGDQNAVAVGIGGSVLIGALALWDKIEGFFANLFG